MPYDEDMPKDPFALIIPFGKHKNSTVGEMLAKDPDYVQWLQAQGWLAAGAAARAALATTRKALQHSALTLIERMIDAE